MLMLNDDADRGDPGALPVCALPGEAPGKDPGGAHGGAYLAAGLPLQDPEQGHSGHGRRAHRGGLQAGGGRGGHDQRQLRQWCAWLCMYTLHAMQTVSSACCSRAAVRLSALHAMQKCSL